MNLGPAVKKIKLSDNMAETQQQADEKALNKFSRQNAALGAETTAKLSKMKVFIYGFRSVGVETAKNLALQGVGGITLCDPEPTTMADVGVNFFLRKEDIGKPRDQCILPRLQELNPLCAMAVAPFDTTVIEAHTAVVITRPMNVQGLISINERCRAKKIGFFYCFTGGVCSSIFTDLGDEHIVHDFDGEKPVQKIISTISVLNETELLIRYDTPEGQPPMAINDGHFEISEVVGMNMLNSTVFEVSHPWRDPVKTIRIKVDSTASFGAYVSGGILTEKKVPKKYPMHSYASKLKNPGEFVSTDLLYFGSEMQLHVAYYATLNFFTKHTRLPAPNSEAEVAEIISMAKELLSNGSIEFEGFDLDEAVVKKFAVHAGVELQAMGAFLGGVLAQEVVKCTGKFTPIPGFMHFWAPETLPSETPVDVAPRGHQNDELAAVFGWPFVEKLAGLNYFMVGCGALGCEFMKNFALNGVCCGPTGKLHVTDADRIELSNLSRQFLFREHNVGQPKSRAAAEMARIINPDFNVSAMELFVGPKTENIFNDSFWASLAGVCNALDNMEARLYVDQMCVKYEKSLLESGTMGTAGNVDTICPFKTRTYKDGGAAAETGGVPMCTLRNFPHLTDHCIEWSRDQFELLFAKLGKSCEAYLQDPIKFDSSVRSKAGSEAGAAIFDIRSAISFARAAAAPSIGSAAQLAFDLFHYLFRDRILDLQAACPADSRITDPKTGEDKGPFWIKEKRYPKVLVFDATDPAHLEFLLSATCLFAVALRILPPKEESDDNWLKEYRGQEWIAGVASGLTPPAYMPAPVGKLTEDEGSSGSSDSSAVDNLISKLLAELSSVMGQINTAGRSPTDLFETADFEKDDDLNFHISFIASTANMRCDNYHIKRTDFHSCKVIAGKIIAAIATTTAAVCGLVMLEMFKLLQDKPYDAFMNRQIGLSTNTFTSFTQEEPVKYRTHEEKIPPDMASLPADAFDEKGKVKDEYIETTVLRAYPEGHSTWDKLTCSANMTLKEFSAWLSAEHGLKLTSWDFTYGYKIVTDSETKEKRREGVSARIYPAKVILNYAHIPSLELTLQEATKAIMKNPDAKPTQQYLTLWRDFKKAGAVPPQPVLPPDTITEDTSVKDILMRMASLAEVAESTKAIDLRAISGVEMRQFVVIPGTETPNCSHIESGDDIEHLAAIKFMLD